MSNINPEIIAASFQAAYGLGSEAVDKVLERARANAIAKDGIGMGLLPRSSQESLMAEAYHELEAEKVKPVPKLTPEQLEHRALIKRAAKPEKLEDQAALVRYHQSKGMSPDAAARAAQADIDPWGAKLGSLTKGKKPKDWKAAERDNAGADKPGNSSDEKKPSANPWADDEPDPARIAAFISRAGTSAARALAAKAGKTISGAPLVTR